ncbi:amino acid racemase [Patescibacteria group bacterium]|nr:amino acid racemase [Patescibacteria group bacterium]MBU1721546.1 amino acid racemase [Patescibacteria group bacterium]MBU1901476.1 amino acid racemase [Patescibacteria group bacterium]
MKIIGIIGGMGPFATIDFESKLLSKVHAEKDSDYPVMITINNSNIPDRTKALLSGGKSPVEAIKKSIHLLKNTGAEVLVLPCNTAHAFYDDFKSEFDAVDFVHIIKESVSYIKKHYPHMKKITVFATEGVMHTRLYHTLLEQEGFEVIDPSKEQQKIIMDAIYKIKANNMTEPKSILEEQTKIMIEQGAEGIILGCTELPLVMKSDTFPFFDATDILAEAVIAKAMEKIDFFSS